MTKKRSHAAAVPVADPDDDLVAPTTLKKARPPSLDAPTPRDAPGVVLMWFRNADLRLMDNTALSHASDAAAASGRPLVALFVLSFKEWEGHDLSPVKVDFLLRNLEFLRAGLEELGIPMVVAMSPTRKGVPGVVDVVVEKVDAREVYWNVEYEVNEGIRDKAVEEAMKERGVKTNEFHDQCIVEPGIITTKGGGTTYTVFSPYKKSWIQYLVKRPLVLASKPTSQSIPKKVKEVVSAISVPIPSALPPELFSVDDAVLSNVRSLFPPGEDEASSRLALFALERIGLYKPQRDFPGEPGTSKLSPYLAAGVISARTCLAKALMLNKNKYDSGSEGVTTWISELCWRDFYKGILHSFPRVCKRKPFLMWTDDVLWADGADVERKFKRWCDGKTGYPIVDAGMRQVQQDGWMHNRVRMITAMFLVKDLGIDWRMGERWFMRHLIDGDFASNNGGWQWAASTGTDAQPYFRVFNPKLQSERFDPDGVYIKKYVPELADVPAKCIHDPWETIIASKVKKAGYPKKIVDHKVASEKIKALFKAAHTASKGIK
ncbi:hypothetical protein HK101_004615 [Irineochytrium annulatum]|nr:hypothetical protein HK101_004615 [Irineochytrium annulatum]